MSTEGQSQERIERVHHGHGQEAVVEELRTVITPATGIRTWDAYQPAHKEVERLALGARPALNAVVLKEWREALSDPEIGPWMILTNAVVDGPWTLVNAYDDRSWIDAPSATGVRC